VQVRKVGGELADTLAELGAERADLTQLRAEHEDLLAVHAAATQRHERLLAQLDAIERKEGDA
jgi:hypothetical protein